MHGGRWVGCMGVGGWGSWGRWVGCMGVGGWGAWGRWVGCMGVGGWGSWGRWVGCMGVGGWGAWGRWVGCMGVGRIDGGKCVHNRAVRILICTRTNMYYIKFWLHAWCILHSP